MSKDWEQIFLNWSKPLGITETERSENAVKSIKNAIGKSSKLNHRDIEIIVQGSYKNNTNVKNDSDVDIGVICHDSFFHDYPEGTTKETFGNIDASYFYPTYKTEVYDALVEYFGSKSVVRGNKAINLNENSYHVEADVVPFFEHRRYSIDKKFIEGVELRPDNNSPPRVKNWPAQHYENGVSKNKNTNTKYKKVVRIIKSLSNEMVDNSIQAASGIPGFLMECLVWNVPDTDFFYSTYYSTVRSCLAHLFNNTRNNDQCNDWGEVSDLKYLFTSSQKWTRKSAHNFISAAWDYIGYE